MNRDNQPDHIDAAASSAVPGGHSIASNDVAGGEALQKPFIEIKGREGCKTVFRKQLVFLEEITDAEVQKLLGIARRLPAIAFDALFDPNTIELALNDNGEVYHELFGEPMVYLCDMRASDAEEFIRKIAGYLKTTITREHPWIEGILPLDGSRFAGQIPPIVRRPVFSIRRRAVRVFTLDEYVDNGVMTGRQSENLRRAISDKKNVLVLGGTSSGKTTLGNAVLHEITVMDPGARQIILEDTPELNSTARNKVYYQTSECCSMTDLLKIALRMRPDRIIVGEVRSMEAFDLAQAWNTGHGGGLATLHANDCASGLRRLKSLISQHPFAPQDIEPDIALAVDVMVNIVKSGTERRVREIVAVKEYDPNLRQNNGYYLEVL